MSETFSIKQEVCRISFASRREAPDIVGMEDGNLWMEENGNENT